MNWKITKAKTIVSCIIGILFALFFQPILSQRLWYTILLSLIGFMVGFGLVYLIWSLVQKREQPTAPIESNQTESV
jgi:F0F1-type ATP synthase assembly protein I